MNWGRTLNARRTLVGLAAAAALAVPAQAGAATAGKVGGTIAVGSGSEAASLSITRTGDDFLVSDSLGNLSAGSGCSKLKDEKVKCPAAGVTWLAVVLAGGSDTLDATDASVPVSVWGGTGDDTLHMRNSSSDWVSCGEGSDSGTADAADSVSSDCESTLERPIGDSTGFDPSPEPAPAPGSEPGSSSPPPGNGSAPDAGADSSTDATAPVAITSPATIRMSPQGAIAVGVSCTASEGVCAGSIELVEEAGTIRARAQVSSARRRSARRKGAVLGRGKFSVRSGAAKRVQVQLSRNGRRRIIKKKKKKTRAKIVITMRAPDGTVTTTEKKVSIAAPKARRTNARRGSAKKPSGRTRR